MAQGLCLFLFGGGVEAGVRVGERLRAVWRRAGGLALASKGAELDAGADLVRRRTLALPSILSPGLGLNGGIPKPTQANLRRFAETPLVRRAINVIKDRIVAMDWQVRVRRGAGEVGYEAHQAEGAAADAGGAEFRG